jgi:AcrR family transcriptional regulator
MYIQNMNATLKSKTQELRRQHILDAAAKVFVDRGYRGATVRDVAKEAGVADGTIYSVFASKSELLDALMDRLAPKTGPSASALPPLGNLEELLKFGIQARWQSLNPDVLELLRTVLAEGLIDPSRREDILAKLVLPAVLPMQNMFAQPLEGKGDGVLQARAIYATYLGFVILLLLGEKETKSRFDEIPKAMADMFINGVLKNGRA